MIATRHFVFLHLHKSGGTFVNDWLLRFVPGARQIGYHLPRRMIPPDLTHLPALGLVRNPWSYYVSWYSFQACLARPNVLFQVLSERGALGFGDTIRNMLDLGTGGTHLDALIAALPSSYGSRGINLPGSELATIRGTGLGFYSFLYRYMYGGDGPAVGIAQMETMRAELPVLVRQTGETISTEAEAFLAAAAPTNTSAHRPYAEYYDSALRDLVSERDGELIRTYGYRFGE